MCGLSESPSQRRMKFSPGPIRKQGMPRDHPDAPVVLFAGGGSGGHISPGLAIAERLVEIDPRATSLFLCSNRTIDSEMLGRAKVTFHPIPAQPPSIRPTSALRFLTSHFKSKRIARQLFKQYSVTHIVALGGFVAVPVVAAAKARGLPILMTNLDRPPGRANRWMAGRCDRIVSAIELPDLPDFASRVVGMPVRRCSIARENAKTCRERLGLDPSRPTLLITGASQGATSINAFIRELIVKEPGMLSGWQVYHLTGSGDDEALRKAYSQTDIQAVVEPFQHEMALAWGAADLALSRAGASSVAEAAINAVPALFLPYPYHQDMHQKNNARPMEAIGGAVIATDHIDPAKNLKHIGPVLAELLESPSRLEKMRSNLSEHPPADAALDIAKLVLEEIC